MQTIPWLRKRYASPMNEPHYHTEKLMFNQHYRYWVLWKCPNVRFLDYQKVKEAEREKGRELFGSEEEPTALATQVCTHTMSAKTSPC